MNSKANKIQLEWPPLLNLSNDRPHIDASYKNVERNNSVYLNGMLHPLWQKVRSGEYTFDSEGNAYILDGKSFKKNGETLATVSNKGFSKYEIEGLENLEVLALAPLSGYRQYIGIYKGTYTGQWGTVPRYYAFVLNNGTRTDFLMDYATTGDYIDARAIQLPSGCYFLVYDDYMGSESLRVVRIQNILSASPNITYKYTPGFSWKRQIVSVGSSAPSFEGIYLRNVSPVIHIAQSSYDNRVYISLTQSTGEVLSGFDTLFKTFWWDDNSNYIRSITGFALSDNCRAHYWGTATNKNTLKVHVNIGNSGSSSSRSVALYNNKYYVYNSSATSLSQLTEIKDIPRDYRWTNRVMTQTLVDDVYNTDGTKISLDIYTFTEFTKTVTIQAVGANSNLYYRLSNVQGRVTNPNYDAPPPQTIQVPVSPEGVTVTATGAVFSATQINSTRGSATIRLTYKYYSGQSVAQFEIYGGTLEVIEMNSTGTSATKTVSQSWTRSLTNTTEGIDVVWSETTGRSDDDDQEIVSIPCIINDDGNFYSIFNVGWTLNNIDGNSATPWANNKSGQGDYNHAVVALKSDYNYDITRINDYEDKITFNYVDAAPLLDCNVIRGVAYNIDQGFVNATIKAHNTATATPTASSELNTSQYTEIFYSNQSACARYVPGTVRKTDFNYYSQIALGSPNSAGGSEDLLTFVPGGFRVPLMAKAIKDESKQYVERFNILYNVTFSGYAYAQGISWSDSYEAMGTLLTPWQSIDVSAYITAYEGDKVVYRSKDRKWYEISVVSSKGLTTILDDRLILIDTTSQNNCYDSKTKQFFHYASDYNDRVAYGGKYFTSVSGTIPTSPTAYDNYYYIRYTASAINPLYQVMPRDIISSIINPIIPRYRCIVGNEVARQSEEFTSQYIDVFYSDFTNTVCLYRISLKGGSNNADIIKHQLQGLQYPGSTSTTASLSPNIFSKFVNGAGNNDVVIEDYDAYTLTYYDNQPYLIYSASTQVTNLYNGENSFFVLQGQFYGIIDNKLYSLLYSNGAIAGMDAIIDLGSLQFIGNNPMIAFFYDPVTRVIRSFTGDANLDFLYSATKISKFYNTWYDETTQSIWCYTDAGMLVFGSRNIFLLENFDRVYNVQFTNDGITHVVNWDNTYDIVYYKKDGYEVIPVTLETSFYGLGATESTTIDRWNITLYDPYGEKKTSYLKAGVRSITDVTTKSEEKEFKISPESYDKWANSVLISYSPQLIKGQGIRLYLETPLVIQSIIPHVMDNKTGTTTRREM